MPTPTGFTTTAPIFLSTDARINSLIPSTSRFSWLDTNISYSFPTSGSIFGTSSYGVGSEIYSWYGATSAHIQNFRLAFAEVAKVANINFTELADNSSTVGTIRIAFTNTINSLTEWGHAYRPSGSFAGAGDIWIDNSIYFQSFAPNTYNFNATLHEIGHALGLSHSFGSGSSAPLSAAFDNMSYTIMSYTQTSKDGISGNPTTPMLYDILALQYLYGASTTASGNTTYTYGDSVNFLTIWDSGGADTISFTGASGAVINLNAGAWSRMGRINSTQALGTSDNVAIAYGAVIENATGGSGNDTLVGNDVDNVLDGGAGLDSLSGGAGNDTLTGGLGNDILDGGTGTDTASYSGATGGVTVNLALTTAQNTVSAGTDTLTNIENVTGTAFNDTLTGNSGDNVLDGGAGNDTIDGGGGNDTVSFATATGAVTFNVGLSGAQSTGGAGTDTYSNMENVTGSAFADTLYGSNISNLIYGGAGNDFIVDNLGDDIINGDAGNDTIYSYAGNDTLVGGIGNDVLVGGDGIDTLWGGNDDDYLYGGAGNDLLNGELGADWLIGDTGADVANGGDGNDVFFGYADNDIMNGDAGNDTFLLGDGDDTGNGGIGDDWMIGDAGNDILNGDDGTDNLWGFDGNDTLNGGAGNDILIGDLGGTLAGGNDIGNGGDGNDWFYAGAGDDTFNGGTGNDVVFGAEGVDDLTGGAGLDYLYGGAGGDTYRMNLGDGFDFVYDSGVSSEIDKIIFGSGIAQSDVRFVRSNSDLLVYYSATDSFNVQFWFVTADNQIEQFRFASGATLSASQVNSMAI